MSTEEVTDEAQEPLLLDNAIVDKTAESMKIDGKDYYKKLNRHERWHLHQQIAATSRPDWHSAPPHDLGSPSHGKLKADQWRSCIEFDFPVALAKITVSANRITSGEYSIWRQKLFSLTVNLAMAIRQGTSHVVSSTHSMKYTKYMHAYLSGLRSMFPQINLLPNHHNALLLRFAPMHRWWSYPTERLIGALQQTQTNSKIGISSSIKLFYNMTFINVGELEKTMLQGLSTAANIESFLRKYNSSKIMKECRELFSQCLDDDDGRNALRMGMQTLESLQDEAPYSTTVTSKEIKWQQSKELTVELKSAFIWADNCFKQAIHSWDIPQCVFSHNRHTVNDLNFADFTTSPMTSIIFF